MNDLALYAPQQNISTSLIDSTTVENMAKTLDKIRKFHAVVHSTLNPVTDYGIIPGTNKPTLLKPGAETMLMLFGLASSIQLVSATPEQLTKDTEFVAYTTKVQLLKDGIIVSEGIGTCNSMEKKYQKASALDVANTILKMAEKRALIDAVLHVASLSAVFTQDIEDMQDFLQDEKEKTMTVEDASKHKITFGKHKGKTLGELYKTEQGWIKWYLEQEKQDPTIVKAIEILKNAAANHKKNKDKPATPEQEAPPIQDEAADGERLPWDTDDKV